MPQRIYDSVTWKVPQKMPLWNRTMTWRFERCCLKSSALMNLNISWWPEILQPKETKAYRITQKKALTQWSHDLLAWKYLPLIVHNLTKMSVPKKCQTNVWQTVTQYPRDFALKEPWLISLLCNRIKHTNLYQWWKIPQRKFLGYVPIACKW